MTTESIATIRRSFSLLAPRLEQLSEEFYRNLFLKHPELRILFPADLQLQQKHLAASLALIVRNAGMLDALSSAFRQLGADHARAGVRPEHYPIVRDTLLQTMHDLFTPSGTWTESFANNWRDLIDQIATTMLSGTLKSCSVTDASTNSQQA